MHHSHQEETSFAEPHTRPTIAYLAHKSFELNTTSLLHNSELKVCLWNSGLGKSAIS